MSDRGTDTAFRHDFPAWVPRVVAMPPVLIALVSIVTVLGSDEVWPITVAVTVALLPWLVNGAGSDLPPWLFAVWVLVPMAVLNLAGDSFGVDLSSEGHSQFTLMMVIWLLGEMAAVGRPSELIGTALAVLAIIAGRTVVDPDFTHAWMFWAGGAGIALVTGYLLRIQQRTLSELRLAQAALAEDAVQRERQRIAREVHDVVAHTMTVTLMHVQAARRALDRDPGGARDALEEAETLGRRSLADIRRTVGLLRADGDRPETHALPDARDIAELLGSYRSAGVDLRATIDIDLGELDPAAGLTLYRLIQEALANAASHVKQATVELTIRADGADLVVEICNDLPATATAGPPGGPDRDGLGLVGMRERVRLLGGDLRAGPEGNRWRLHARFPSLPASVPPPPTEAAR